MEWSQFNLSTDFISGVQSPGDAQHSFHIVISDGEILSVDEAAPWRPLNQDELHWLGLTTVSTHFLGLVGNIPLYATEVDPETDEPEGYVLGKLWSFLGRVTEPTLNMLGRATQIVEWHSNHQFCGQCGQPTQPSDMDRSRKCAPCRQMFYPRLSPSIIVLVTRGDELLLARNANARGNFYSTLAGFVEPGESIEEAVHREVLEEVGIQIKNLKYFASQSWPFPNSLMLGFHAEYAGGEFVLQEAEIADAQWFHHTNLPSKPAMMSISGWLIHDFLQRVQQGAT